MRLTPIRAGVKRATNFSKSGVKGAASFGPIFTLFTPDSEKLVALLTPALIGVSFIFKTGGIRAGVKGAGVQKRPAEKGSIRYEGEYRTGMKATLFCTLPCAEFTRRLYCFFCKQSTRLLTSTMRILWKIQQFQWGKSPCLSLSKSEDDFLYTANVFDQITVYNKAAKRSIPCAPLLLLNGSTHRSSRTKRPSDLFPAPLYSRSMAVRLWSQQQNSLLITKKERSYEIIEHPTLLVCHIYSGHDTMVSGFRMQ